MKNKLKLLLMAAITAAGLGVATMAIADGNPEEGPKGGISPCYPIPPDFCNDDDNPEKRDF
jgi:hypothetical protein